MARWWWCANRELEFRIDGAVGASRFYCGADESGVTGVHPTVAASGIKEHVWFHYALSRNNGTAIIFKDGVAIGSQDWSAANITGGTATFCIGDGDEGNDDSDDYNYHGWMDGARITIGMARYTSGIPTDGQSPAKDYDDGRTSNGSSPDWATSSTRRYYGINTHTYLQTTEYSTDANTVLMMRGDDAETANDGVNMYGENGFHLEFKEVGAGEERDYNNFNTGAQGLGSDTSATQEFADDATVFLLRSRPNQANGSTQFINEVDQSRLTETNEPHHNESFSPFGIDANTANVSIASGGSGTY